ncbi:TPA: DUF2971 domain-containing protein [Providencia rettgeri]
MILYKYVKEEDISKILNLDEKNSYVSLKFSKASSFNDPFETYGYSFQEEDFVENLLARGKLNDKYFILCLTKNPLIPLMWSHYADKHTGYVIGIDVDEAGLNDNSFLIKINDGAIKYQHKRSGNINTELPQKKFEEIYLNKAFYWEYEEEYRAVLGLNYLEKVGDDENLHIKRIGINSVKELYIGLNNKKFNNEFYDNLIKNIQNINIYKCKFKNKEWSLKIEKYFPNKTTMSNVILNIEKITDEIVKNQ